MKMNKVHYIAAALGLFMAVGCGSGHQHEGGDPSIHKISEEDAHKTVEQGKLIVEDAQATFKSNLMNAMKESGPVGALGFCNQEASTIAATLSEKHKVVVRRVSSKNRNPENAPSNNEINVLNRFQKNIDNGTSGSLVTSTGDVTSYYQPIMVGAPCITCHGKKDEMVPELVAVIDSLYPNDKATGYAIGELRGTWVVEFLKENG